MLALAMAVVISIVGDSEGVGHPVRLGLRCQGAGVVVRVSGQRGDLVTEAEHLPVLVL